MMETPRAMLRAEEIAAADPRVGCLVMGTSDLAKELHAAHTPERLPMITALGLCLLAARACGRAILDGVHLDLEDDVGFAASCRHGAELGFDGKTLIHPSQIPAANEVFGPTVGEVTWARAIIAAFALPENRDKGALQLEGKMVERLHAEIGRRTVAIAEAIAARG
jgi:citrate lyase subunit beta/citryl-CoA lyase